MLQRENLFKGVTSSREITGTAWSGLASEIRGNGGFKKNQKLWGAGEGYDELRRFPTQVT